MIERSEETINRTMIVLTAADAGLTATIDETGERVSIVCSAIEGQSTLRVSSSMLDALSALVDAVRADPALVIPEPPEEQPTEP